MRSLKPSEPDQLFLWPEPTAWPELAAQNRKRLQRPDGPWRLATSHQPVLFHAGIWVREFVLEQVAANWGWESVYFEADSDECEVSAEVPRLEPLRVERVGLARGILEHQSAPDRATWNEFCQRIRSGLPAGLELRGDWQEQSNLARFLAAMRWRAGDLQELERGWQSRWLESPLAARLVEPILADPEDFRACYNRALAQERAERRLRSRAHPFPDLRMEDGRVELPLWVERRPLFYELATDRLWTDRPLAVAHEWRELSLRPRAMLWTAFCRLSCDLYLHGTGGAAYDRATDRVLESFYQLEPPGYAVAWLNYRLALPADEKAPARLLQATQELRSLEHNPQRYLPEHPLAREKIELVAALTAAPRGKRASLTRAIRRINRQLETLLAPLRLRMQAERAAARLACDELAAARYRGYSWLLVDPEKLRAISSLSRPCRS